ncbi:MAG TPA: polysaccharide deacetylase family protein [Anaerolineales bacterium]|nr:polysaccharide deacetylase family protein [Anaerolineales bacterium]
MQKTILLILLFILPFTLFSCNLPISEAKAPDPGNTDEPPTPPPATDAPTETPTDTPTPTITPTATTIPTITTVPTPTWAIVGPGEVIAPILMYHDIDPEKVSRYNTPPEVFIQQMQALADWGYQTITAEQLTQAITEGAPLPERPVILTFDDGHYKVYEYAYPIMKEHGFFGVAYIVANRLQAHGFMGEPQLTEMAAAGWEIGSHSYTHADLTIDHNQAFNEIYYSREDIETDINQPVTSFAYPFGAFDRYLGDRTLKWGYTNAMGLGGHWTHTPGSVYYLQRIEVRSGITMEEFAALLPWSTPPEPNN